MVFDYFLERVLYMKSGHFKIDVVAVSDTGTHAFSLFFWCGTLRGHDEEERPNFKIRRKKTEGKIEPVHLAKSEVDLHLH